MTRTQHGSSNGRADDACARERRSRLHQSALATTALLTLTAAEYPDHGYQRPIKFPDTLDGSKLLTADLHTHTVFSDGHVWPSIRVEEADRDSIDALALTEHLEHNPKSADIPHPDRNRSYQVAKEVAESQSIDELLLINGSEITRDMPPGHVNAVFITDANRLLVDDPIAAINAANQQEAFVFWNHPSWIPQAPDGVSRLLPMHEDLIREGKLHGIEVANGTADTYSEHALDIALQYNLTVLGTSDIHGLVDWTHNAGHGGHRPMTIVLARERSLPALKEALFDGRTVAWNYDDLIGRADNVEAVVEACLTLEPNAYFRRSTVMDVTLTNDCPMAFTLRNVSPETFQNFSDVVSVNRYGTTPLHVRTGRETSTVSLEFEVLNTQIGGRRHARVALSSSVNFSLRD